MEITVLLFLTSGLFLGWALGANDAANVFGTAVGTHMIRFSTAAAICSVFVILGAVNSGAGAAATLGKLGAIDALAGAFMAAFSAALAVYMMTKAGLPVSTTQAIVGAIIGWNLFTATATDSESLTKILATWLVCPVLAAAISVGLYKVTTRLLASAKLHLLRTDAYTRLGLLIAGAFGSYSLGANNIGNVIGVFVPSSPFTDFTIAGLFTLSSTEQLFLFASQGLEQFLASYGLPTIPLVPVSSSQAVVGAVLGIAILKGGWAFAGGSWAVSVPAGSPPPLLPVWSVSSGFISCRTFSTKRSTPPVRAPSRQVWRGAPHRLRQQKAQQSREELPSTNQGRGCWSVLCSQVEKVPAGVPHSVDHRPFVVDKPQVQTRLPHYPTRTFRYGVDGV